MKTQCQIRLISTLCALIFLTFNSYSQSPPVTTIGTATYSAGVFSVPVTVSGFVNVGNISMTIIYDPAILVYSGVSLNTGLLPGNSVVTPVTDQSGTFRMSYTSQQVIVLAAPVNTLLTLSFTPKPGSQGVRTNLTWSTVNGDCDITPPFPAVFVPAISVANQATYFINGFIDVSPVPVITGPNSSCAGSSGNVYSTAAGMTNYIWSVSTEGTINSGAGTNSISITWNTAGTGNVNVIYTDPVGGPALVPTVYPVTIAATCDKTVTLTCYLEGLYTTGGLMRQAQGIAGNQYPGTTADVISVELHDAITYSTIIYTASNINLNTSGLATLTVPVIYSGSYFITIKHRNSVETTSATPISFAGSTITHSFAVPANVFGANLKLSGDGSWLIYGGEVNQDGVVDSADATPVVNDAYNYATGYLTTDIDGNGSIDSGDYTIFINNSYNYIGTIHP
jgi:hypothetical protein